MRFVKPTDLDATADIFAAYGARNIDHILNGTLLPLISTEILERMGTGTLGESLAVGLDAENNFDLQF